MRYPGQRYDAATGLSYNYFRDYDQSTGRYVQSDPIGLDGGISTYGYANGSPTMYSDPEGLIAGRIALKLATRFVLPRLGVQLGARAATRATRGKLAQHVGVKAVARLAVRGGDAKFLRACPPSSNSSVYRSINSTGEVNYIGITNNLERRAAQHLGSKGIAIRRIPGLGNLSRPDARSVEQVLIELHGLARNGGTLINRINSIARTNPVYAGALQRGTAVLRGVGYPGI